MRGLLSCGAVRRSLLCATLAVIVLATGCTIEAPFGRMARRLNEYVVTESARWPEWNKIALIDVDGFIGDGGGILWSGTSVADVKEKLKMAADDGSVKGVLLRINSPGGEVTSCDIIYNELRAFSEKNRKPIVAYTMGMATSGGYYTALAADSIVAHPTSITGNIGVVMQFMNVEGLMMMLGVRTETIKSGAKKDMGSPFRGMSAEETAVFEGINKQMFDRFLDLVKKRRRLSEQAASAIADGRVLSAQQAKELGLVDRLGDMDDALAEVKRLAGIRYAKVVVYRPYQHYNTNAYARFGWPVEPQSKSFTEALNALSQDMGPRFLYIWAP